MKLYKSVTVCLIISIILFTDLCNVDNGGCDDIAECKHAESGVACVCPDGYRLDPSGKQCLGMYFYCIMINIHTSEICHLGATNNSKNEESIPEHRMRSHHVFWTSVYLYWITIKWHWTIKVDFVLY